MTIRCLPPEEWPKLAGTEAESVWPGLNPADARVLVVEDAGAIIGTWVLMRVVHAECIWIAPSHRGKAGVLSKLLRGMRGLTRAWNTPSVFAGSMTEGMSAMIRRIGGIPVPGEHFAIPTGER